MAHAHIEWDNGLQFTLEEWEILSAEGAKIVPYES